MIKKKPCYLKKLRVLNYDLYYLLGSPGSRISFTPTVDHNLRFPVVLPAIRVPPWPMSTPVNFFQSQNLLAVERRFKQTKEKLMAYK